MSSAHHSQSQGALEQHHQTLKTMLRTFCLDNDKDWDEAVPYVMFVVQEEPTKSLGLLPNHLVFGHHVRGPLDVVRDPWCRLVFWSSGTLVKHGGMHMGEVNESTQSGSFACGSGSEGKEDVL